MTDPISIALTGASALAITGAAAFAGLRAWRQWLDYKRLELAAHHDGPMPQPETAGRIELADLRERVRKLEAIASGIDL
jgi:hypothetical protein